MALNSKRRIAALTGVLAVALTATACGSSDDDGGSDSASSGSSSIDCAPYKAFGDLKGKTVSVYTSITAPEDAPHQASYKPFEDCTGVTIKYEGSKEFEAQLPVRVKGGNAPDIAYLPQPGLLKTLVATGAVKEAPPEVVANVEKNMPDWKQYGTVDGKFYAAALGANVKSFVWYSPQAFKDKGYEVPKTWAELLALSDKIVADNPDGDVKPWCAGIESGDATGWPATDWIEDVMLRTAGPETYDKWVKHEIPFNDPAVATALAEVGKILKNDKYVNGGFGDVKTIASTSFQDAGLPILDGQCYMHRQASFYAANWPEGTKVGPDGDVWAFYLPSVDASTKPVLTAGELDDRVRRPSRGQGLPDLPRLGRVGQRAGQDLRLRRLRDGEQERRPEPADQRGRQAVGGDPHRQGGDDPVRRFRPHAGRRRCGHVLEGHDQLDHRSGRQGHARLHRELLAEELTPDLTPGHPNRGGADALRPTPVLLSPLHRR